MALKSNTFKKIHHEVPNPFQASLLLQVCRAKIKRCLVLAIVSERPQDEQQV